MKPRRKTRGRPLGPVARAVLDILCDDSLTARQIGQLLCLSYPAARYTCSRLESCGLLRVVESVRVPGAHKPVARYACAATAEQDHWAPILQ